MRARHNLRNNALLILSALVYALALVLLAILVDGIFYKADKQRIIRNQYIEGRTIRSQAFDYYVSRLLALRRQEQWSEADARLYKHFEREILALVDSDMGREAAGSGAEGSTSAQAVSPLLEFRLYSEGKKILQRTRGDIRRLHTFRNALFQRDFRLPLTVPIGDRAWGDKMEFDYTTPPHYPAIEALTERYWFILLRLFLGLTIVYILMLRFVVLPIRNVTMSIQESRGGVAQFIAHPRAHLETLYNSMACDALLTALRVGLRDPHSRQLRMTLTELLDHLAPRIREWFGFADACLLELRWESNDVLAPVGQMPPPAEGAAPLWDAISGAVDSALARNIRTSWESRTPRLFRCDMAHRAGRLFLGVVPASRDNDESVQLLALVVDRGARSAPAWQQSTAEGLYEQVLALVEQQSAQSRELMREKGEANISLSRNLGHDLTNIIATNKLELMTVSQVLRGDAATWGNTPEKAAIAKESIERLLDNTRSLQEIVNLYRAFEYLKSPRYEPTDLNRLVREIISVFRLSMSAPVEIACDLEADLPTVRVEPRLVKLAVFNLLSNAQDAIRRLPPSEQARARILVQTQWDHAKNRAVVRLSDTGTGIRTPDGKLADREAIKRIFDMGYTTKTEGAGEGLGLNWVRTILEDFHNGELKARNVAAGGAEFEFVLEKAEQGEPVRTTPNQGEEVRQTRL